MVATLEDLLSYTGKKLDDPQVLQIYLDTAYEIICNYLGYNLEIAFTTEYIKGYGDKTIQTKHKPVNMVYTVIDVENNEMLYEAQHSTAVDYFIKDEFVEFKDIIFPPKVLEVSYVYGYGLLDFGANEFGGGDASTNDWFETAWGMEADIDGLFFEELSGGGANNIGVIETFMPIIFKQTLLRIAALLLAEADNNIGITSKTFGDSGMRTFINYTNFDKYLSVISKYKLTTI
jgi:hypothetical protein